MNENLNLEDMIIEKLGVTRERVRQVESKFLKLGHRPVRKRERKDG